MKEFPHIRKRKPPVKPPPPPVVPPPPPVKPPDPPKPPPAISWPYKTGPITTKGPKGQSLGSWDAVARWWPLFVAATKDQAQDRFGALLLACMAIVESGGNHYRSGKPAGSRAEVVTGGGNPPSVGLMQVVCGLHATRLPQHDCYTPEGQIRLAALLTGEWIRELGSWEAAVSRRYHPGTDPRSGYTPETYVATVRALIHEAKGQTPPAEPAGGDHYEVAGISGRITLPFPLHVVLIPPSQTNQRPGQRMTPDRYVQHDTGNRGAGANALMHLQYMQRGAPDDAGRPQQLGYHFTVDDREAYQMIPVNEVAWHGGDGSGPCNMRGVSCELCINSGIDIARSRENAAILAAEIMNAMAIDRLNKHQDCAGKFCPQDMLNAGAWPWFVQRVNQLRESRS